MPLRLSCSTLEPGHVGLLADGADDAGDGEGLKLTLHRHGTAAATLVGLAQLHDLELHLLHLAVLPHDLGGVGEELIDDALFPGLVDLQLLSGHLRLGAAVDHVDLLGPQADGGAAGVHGGVAAADNGHLVANVRPLSQGHPLEEVDAPQDPVQVLSRAADGHAGPGADGHHHGVVAALKFLEGGVHPDAEVVLHLHTQGGDLVDLLVQHLLGQAVLGDAVAEHAAHLGHGIHNGHPVALQGQVVGRGEAARAAADDAHPLAGGCGLGAAGSRPGR